MNISVNELLSFAGIVTLLIMFPGPNTILVMQTVGVSGRKSGYYNVAGIVTAVYFHALISAIGLSVIIVKSANLYMLIKYLGAAYIFYLGVINLISAYKVQCRKNNSEKEASATEVEKVEESFLTSYTKGVVSNILNPKVAIFFLSFFPQFIHNQNNVFSESMFLTVIYSLIVILWYSLLVAVIDNFGNFMEGSTFKKWLKTITGILLLSLGVKMAIDTK